MSGILITGANGYLGGYACQELLAHTSADLYLLVRARSRREGAEKLWKGWQLHLSVDAFREALRRVHIVPGDLHAPNLGLTSAEVDDLVGKVGSILHIAASLNRKSEKACLNTNLRGGLSMLGLARKLKDRGSLDRYSFVSTVAVAGQRSHEDVAEDASIEWDRSDYDPYARTKKFGEHMVRELLPDVSTLVFRPSIVMGDPQMAATTQFDMIRATFGLAELPVIPIDPAARLDIVDARYVGRALARIHTARAPRYTTYHVSSGRDAPTAQAILDGLAPALKRPGRFAPQLSTPAEWMFRAMNRAPRRTGLAGPGAVMKVFWPYVTYDTVFLNDRVVQELGTKPAYFPSYAEELYRWCKAHHYTAPERPLPEGIS